MVEEHLFNSNPAYGDVYSSTYPQTFEIVNEEDEKERKRSNNYWKGTHEIERIVKEYSEIPGCCEIIEELKPLITEKYDTDEYMPSTNNDDIETLEGALDDAKTAYYLSTGEWVMCHKCSQTITNPTGNVDEICSWCSYKKKQKAFMGIVLGSEIVAIGYCSMVVSKDGATYNVELGGDDGEVHIQNVYEATSEEE